MPLLSKRAEWFYLYFECVEVLEDVIIKEPDNYSNGWLSIQTAKATNINSYALGDISWTNVISDDEIIRLKKDYSFE